MEMNEEWQAKVRTLLGQGYGVEDIAVMTQTKVHYVRAEVAILREDGELEKIIRKGRKL